MRYKIDFNPLHQTNLPNPENFLDSLPLILEIDSAISIEPYTQAIEKFKKFCHVIHLGTGGSSLGPQALYEITTNPAKLFHFFDNIDPNSFSKGLKNINLRDAGVLIASKSGNTAETLIQLATLKKLFEDQNLSLKEHAIIITQTDGNALHTFAQKHDILVVSHHDKIGGRFAVFAEVGILPGLLMGLNMEHFRNGARDMIAEYEASFATHPITQSAYFLATTKLNPVMFPYCDRLKKFDAWFAQLWGESLGKKNHLGERFGSTPLQAIGATDQHSQLQLYIDGPRDKFFTFLEVAESGDLDVSDLEIDHPVFEALCGHSLSDLLTAELHATYHTIVAHNLPARLITLPSLNEHTLGALMLSAVLETLLVASIWAVNPFDQPAVEEGKILALQFLNDKSKTKC